MAKRTVSKKRAPKPRGNGAAKPAGTPAFEMPPPKPGEAPFKFTGTVSQMRACLEHIDKEGRPGEQPFQTARRLQATAEAPVLKLASHVLAPTHPYGDQTSVGDILAFMNDAGHGPRYFLRNAVESAMAELAIVERAVCGDPDQIVAGSDEDHFLRFFMTARNRLEAAIALDERIKAANPVEVSQ